MEYVLLMALIVLVAIVALQFFGSERDNSLSRSGSELFPPDPRMVQLNP